MGAVKHLRKNSLPSSPSPDQLIFVNVAGSYVQYVVNNAGVPVPPAVMSHGHAISDITGLQTALDNKAALNHTHANATTSAAGFMSIADKTKLDGLSNYTHPTSGVTPGTYSRVTVNAQGHVTGGTTPTTLSALGITEKFVSVNPTSGYVLDTVNGVALDSIGLASSFYATGATDFPVGTSAAGYVSTHTTGSTSFIQTYADPATQDSFWFRRKNTSITYGWEQFASRSWVSSAIGPSRWTSGLDGVGNADSGEGGVKTWGTGTSNVPEAYGTLVNFVGASASPDAASNSGSFLNQIGFATSGNMYFRQRIYTYNPPSLWYQIWTGKQFTGTDVLNWNIAYGWGNHAIAGYATAASLSGYVPTTRAITINGITQNLTVDRSWTVPIVVTNITDGNEPQATGFYVNQGAGTTNMPIGYGAIFQINRINGTGTTSRFSQMLLDTYNTNPSLYLRNQGVGGAYSAWFKMASESYVTTTLGGYVTTSTYTTGLAAKENTFSKGDIVQGTNVTLTGTLTGRLVGSGNITINATTSGGVGGFGTPNTIPLWATNTTIGDSGITDNGSIVAVNRDTVTFGVTSNHHIRMRAIGGFGGVIEFRNASGSEGYELQGGGGNFQINRVNSGTSSVFTIFPTGQWSHSYSGGLSPITMSSSAINSNFNADMVDGFHGSALAKTATTITINGVSQSLADNRSWTVTMPVTDITDGNAAQTSGFYVNQGSGTTNMPMPYAAIMQINRITGSGTTSRFAQMAMDTYNLAPTLYLRTQGVGGAYSSWVQMASQSWVTSQGYLTPSSMTGYVPSSRTLIINGLSFDLSANRNIAVGPSAVYGALSLTGGSNYDTAYIQLRGDVDTPGANAYYGTGGSGVKGWYAMPSSGDPTYSQVVAALGYTPMRQDRSMTINGVSFYVNDNPSGNVSPRSVYGQHSIYGGSNFGDVYLSLQNDSGSPGANMLYGTNGSGTKGWYAQPSGGGGGVSGSGSSGYLAIWNGGTSITSSAILQIGSTLAMYGNIDMVGTYVDLGWISTGALASLTPQMGRMVCQSGSGGSGQGVYVGNGSSWVKIA